MRSWRTPGRPDRCAICASARGNVPARSVRATSNLHPQILNHLFETDRRERHRSLHLVLDLVLRLRSDSFRTLRNRRFGPFRCQAQRRSRTSSIRFSDRAADSSIRGNAFFRGHLPLHQLRREPHGHPSIAPARGRDPDARTVPHPSIDPHKPLIERHVFQRDHVWVCRRPGDRSKPAPPDSRRNAGDAVDRDRKVADRPALPDSRAGCDSPVSRRCSARSAGSRLSRSPGESRMRPPTASAPAANSPAGRGDPVRVQRWYRHRSRRRCHRSRRLRTDRTLHRRAFAAPCRYSRALAESVLPERGAETSEMAFGVSAHDIGRVVITIVREHGDVVAALGRGDAQHGRLDGAGRRAWLESSGLRFSRE